MRKHKKNEKMEHGFYGHPMIRRRPRMHHFSPIHMMRHGMHRFPMGVLEEIESKEEAIEFLEMQSKMLDKRKKYLEKRMARLDSTEDALEDTIKEIGKMKEFSHEEMKKIMKKNYKEFMKKMIDEDDF